MATRKGGAGTRRRMPSESIMDSRSAKTSTNVPTTTHGIDAGKRIIGRKRGNITDTLACCSP